MGTAAILGVLVASVYLLFPRKVRSKAGQQAEEESGKPLPANQAAAQGPLATVEKP
jgi:hypothetical protein